MVKVEVEGDIGIDYMSGLFRAPLAFEIKGGKEREMGLAWTNDINTLVLKLTHESSPQNEGCVSNIEQVSDISKLGLEEDGRTVAVNEWGAVFKRGIIRVFGGKDYDVNGKVRLTSDGKKSLWESREAVAQSLWESREARRVNGSKS